MLRSLYAGVSGMKNNQVKMDVIGNNISNVNTTAFKSGRVRFQDMLSQTIKNAAAPTVGGIGGINPRQVGLGSQVAGIDTITNQGNLQPTGRPLDAAIEGDGYFILSDGINYVYTRDGSFNFDSNFNIVNSDGFNLVGYKPLYFQAVPVDAGDDIASGVIKDKDGNDVLEFSNLNYDNKTTGLNSVKINGVTLNFYHDDTLPAGVTEGRNVNPTTGEVTWNYKGIKSIGDIFTKINNNGEIGVKAELKHNTIMFTANAGENIIDIRDGEGLFKNVSTPTPPSRDPEELFSLSIPEENPFVAGEKIVDFSIDPDGTIKGIYDSGNVEVLGIIPIAKFANPAGLLKLGGNNYSYSSNSGEPQKVVAAKEAGKIRQSNLEMSNVDLANEFTDMIVTSRAFQANSRTITTSDEMLQELLNLKR